MGGAVVGTVAVVAIVWSGYEIVTYRPCHPSGPLTEIGEHIADHFIPIEDDAQEDYDEMKRQQKCYADYLAQKTHCEDSGYSPGAREICLQKAQAQLVNCIGPENWPPRW